MPVSIDIKALKETAKNFRHDYNLGAITYSCLMAELALEKYLNDSEVLFTRYTNQGRHGFIISTPDKPIKIVSCSIPEYGKNLLIEGHNFDNYWDYYVGVQIFENEAKIWGIIECEPSRFGFNPQGFNALKKPTYFLEIFKLKPIECLLMNCSFKAEVKE